MNTRHHAFTNWLLSGLLTTLLASCGGGGGGATDNGNNPPAGGDKSVAARTSVLAANDSTCPQGGILVETGIDENGNGLLDDAEVDNAEKVCNGQNGASGLNSLVALNNEPVGANCANGGLRIDSGLDANANGSLEASEIGQTRYVCNPDAIAGPAGNDGLNSLISFADEPPGANCPYGGMRVDGGLDANANGSLESSEITSTQFVCNQLASAIGWQVPELIEAENLGHALAPQIAFDANGNAIAVWYQPGGAQYSIYANHYQPGLGWGTAGLIENNTGEAYNPQIAFDANGNAIAVWRQFDGTRYNIWANRYDAATGSWGTAELIETDTGWAVAPQIAIDANGNAIAVWVQSDGTRDSIWANRYVPGAGWGTAELVETDNAGHAYYPQVAIDANGNAIAVWDQDDGTRYNIWANRWLAP